MSDKPLVTNRNNSTACSPYNDKFTLNPTLIYEVSLELLLQKQNTDVCSLLTQRMAIARITLTKSNWVLFLVDAPLLLLLI
jgi:hypothetical protein